jgi:hypothetical protein
MPWERNHQPFSWDFALMATDPKTSGSRSDDLGSSPEALRLHHALISLNTAERAPRSGAPIDDARTDRVRNVGLIEYSDLTRVALAHLPPARGEIMIARLGRRDFVSRDDLAGFVSSQHSVAGGGS